MDINDQGVNSYFEQRQNRISFRNMVYIGDSDIEILCIKLVNINSGHSIGVYNSETKIKSKVFRILDENRIKYYIHHYRLVLENRNMIKICLISRNKYDVLKDEYWIEQLNMMKRFIYLYEAQKSIEKETIKGCLKKILIKNGKFKKNEVENLLL